jgi:hypothetical protein
MDLGDAHVGNQDAGGTLMVEPMVNRQFLGVVSVDSGTLIISDPAYCLPHIERDKPGVDYEAVVAADTSLASSYLGDGLVLLLSNFGGDGTFPVFGEFEEGQLMRVTIEFVGPGDDEGDDAAET